MFPILSLITKCGTFVGKSRIAESRSFNILDRRPTDFTGLDYDFCAELLFKDAKITTKRA